MGYLGGGLLLYRLNHAHAAEPAATACTTRRRRCGLVPLVGVWWLVFSLPLLVFVKYRRYANVTGATAIIADSLVRLWHTAKKIVQRRELLLFLIAYWLYFRRRNTFIRMARILPLGRRYAQSQPAGDSAVQFVALPASLAFGCLAKWFGPRRMIIAGRYHLPSRHRARRFRSDQAGALSSSLPALTALAQGGRAGAQPFVFREAGAARSEAAEYFGFYNIVGRFASSGPAMVGIIGAIVHGSGTERCSPRASAWPRP